MRKIITVLALSLLLFSCSSGPESIAKKFTENLSKGKVEEAKKLATESTGKMIDLLNGFGGVTIDPNYKFEMIKDSIVENKAWITYINQEGEEDVLELVKIDGDWLVHSESKK